MTHYNIALICTDKKQNQALCDLSQNLRDMAPSLYVLGENSVPHISLAHFETNDSAILPSLWQKLNNKQDTIIARAEQYFWHPGYLEQEKYYYIGIVTNRSEELVAWHQKALNIIAPLQATSESGEEFFPHFTLGCNCLSDEMNPLKVLKLIPSLWGEEISLKLALGQSGLEGQLEKLLFVDD